MAVIHDKDPWKDPWGDTEAPRRRYRWLWLLLVLAVAGGIGYYLWHPGPSFPEVTAVSCRLTDEADGKGLRWIIDRRTSPEVWFHVLLRNAPIDAALPLNGEWIDPSGKVYHRNRYETDPIFSRIGQPIYVVGSGRTPQWGSGACSCHCKGVCSIRQVSRFAIESMRSDPS